MAAQTRKKSVNLLPQEEFAQTTTGLILSWALTIGRTLVILTELIVIAAFLSRFFLDAKITDLGDEIKQKKALIEASSEFEKRYRKISQKLAIFSEMSSSYTPSQVIDIIAAALPSDTVMDSFSYSKDEGGIIINGSSLSEASLASFIYSLKTSGKFSAVVLDKVSNPGQSDPSLKFSLTLKEEGGK